MFSATSRTVEPTKPSNNGHSTSSSSYRPSTTTTTSSSTDLSSSNAAAIGTSVIGRDLTLLGEKITIVSQNKLRVDGDVRGNVHGKEVIITDGGSVEGMVSAEKIEVHGGVRGSIRAVSVTLHSTGKVDGDIMHHMLAISEGAQFDGRVRRSNDTSELMPVLDPELISAGQV
jgi:cytoskeletal protein CcmA (bactofilin family)